MRAGGVNLEIRAGRAGRQTGDLSKRMRSTGRADDGIIRAVTTIRDAEQH
jgi:hypothetical protein